MVMGLNQGIEGANLGNRDRLRESACPRGVMEARNPAKVEGQVRLLAGTFGWLPTEWSCRLEG